MELPSGRQYALAHGDARAVVTEVGATLRTFDVGEVEVLDGFSEDAVPDGGRGQTLLPWPNRVADGQWSWDGQDLQLPLTEPARHNASHGLTRWALWELVDQAPDQVRLQYRLHPQPGWPFLLRCEIAYVLGDLGLTVTTTLTNTGPRACPVAAGAHPYLSAGGGLVDDCTLEVAARTVVPTDDRGIPTGTEPVDGLSGLIGDRHLDVAYTDLARDSEDRVTARLQRPDGVSLELWGGTGYRYLQVYTGDTLTPDRRRRGVAIEPMTAPANALQTGQDLDRLAPGQQLVLSWGITLD